MVQGEHQIARRVLMEMRHHVQDHPLLVLLVLLVMVLVTWRSLRGSWGWVGVLFVLSFFWVLINKSVEGPVLVYFNQKHGITLADLLSLSWVVVVIVRWAFGGRDAEFGRAVIPDWSILGPVSPIPAQRDVTTGDGGGADLSSERVG